MIKSILVALDPDTDTPVATRHAGEIARRFDAEVIGLAVLDMGSIEAGSRGGGIGSMYLVENLRKNLTDEARATAQRLLSEFETAMHDAGVRYTTQVKEGVPFRRILEDMKYHDLLVVGQEPHFFYSHPEQKTETLERVVEDSVAPALVVRTEYRPIRRVLIAYDGSDPAARTLQRFVHLEPFGKDLEIEVFHVFGKGGEAESELMLHLVKEYLRTHGFQVSTSHRSGSDPHEVIVEHARQSNADVVVLGGHSVSRLRQFAFGSTTASLLNASPVPLFLYH